MPPEFRCFDIFAPYTNSNWHLPASPSEIGIQFKLFTAQNPHSPQHLYAGSTHSFLVSHWNSSRDTKIIVHGFTCSSLTDWVPQMVAELLHHSVNVIVVDWAAGARGPNYFQAVANTRVVGAEVAYLIQTAESLGQPAGRFHVIGHSLGAQTGGYAGMYLHGRLGRITGLDPAAPLFENYDNAVKLDKTDAHFVDVIHTDAGPLHELGLGTVDQIGHADFFPNSGHDMPGCPQSKFSWTALLTGEITSLTDDVSCSHNRAPKYFSASINVNPFTAYPCASTGGVCQHCGAHGCARMGYHASPTASGLYVLTTHANFPY